MGSTWIEDSKYFNCTSVKTKICARNILGHDVHQVKFTSAAKIQFSPLTETDIPALPGACGVLNTSSAYFHFHFR